MHFIFNKDHLFEVWEVESKRFRQLYDHINEDMLDIVIRTSPQGRYFRDYPTCFFIWMDAALRRFQGEKGEWKTMNITEYTDKHFLQYKDSSLTEVWQKLENKEKEFRALLETKSEEELLNNKSNWHWIVWTTFGHYDEHSSQIEAHFAGENEKPVEKVWTNPCLFS